MHFGSSRLDLNGGEVKIVNKKRNSVLGEHLALNEEMIQYSTKNLMELRTKVSKRNLEFHPEASFQMIKSPVAAESRKNMNIEQMGTTMHETLRDGSIQLSQMELAIQNAKLSNKPKAVHMPTIINSPQSFKQAAHMIMFPKMPARNNSTLRNDAIKEPLFFKFEHMQKNRKGVFF